MKVISPSVELILQGDGMEGMYKHIELAGRTAYKSENRATSDSAKKFVDALISQKHLSVLEHGTIFLRSVSRGGLKLGKYKRNPYSAYNEAAAKDAVGTIRLNFFVTTNYRVMVENGWLADLNFSCPYSRYHERRATIRFVLSRAIANEFVRHRQFSFVQESTRWCNYSKDKFENEITCIRPSSLEKKESFVDWVAAMGEAEKAYMSLISDGVKPETARGVLPLDLKTELVMTGTITQWQNFFKLRCANDAHPDARSLALKAKELIEQEYIIE